MTTKEIIVKGMVQGIGFRPFVAELAEKFQISGWVRNVNGSVVIHATAEDAFLAVFLHALKFNAPLGANVVSIETRDITEDETVEVPDDGKQFHIMESAKIDYSDYPLIPSDLATCQTCEAELRNPKNRRYHHPFISCTACGPRYSIIEALPYDRERITMKKFPMCSRCREEYEMKANRRRHAQTVACWDCGPQVSFMRWDLQQKQWITDESHDYDCIEAARNWILQGKILAVKDIGGFHLACSAGCEEAVAALRILKGREKKPFAVMFRDINHVREYCEVNTREESLLLDDARPIVLLKRKEMNDAEAAIHPNVYGNSPDIGAFLPCNPIQIMLLENCGPLIMTSANHSGELLYLEEEQVRRMFEASEMDHLAILTHDRPILTPLDDSIVRVISIGQKPNQVYYEQTIRRARGYVPNPITVPFSEHFLAVGGDLKATFCYTGNNRAYLSQYLGDLSDEACFAEYQKQMEHMKALFKFIPSTVIHDAHPGYRSVQHLKMMAGLLKRRGNKMVQIQHHMAHAASVLAEHDVKGDAICFAFDGTGYGTDGTIWGSEVFLWSADERQMTRINHLPPVQLIGGDEGARNAQTILYGYLANAGRLQDCDMEPQIKEFLGEQYARYEVVQKAIAAGIHTVTSTSMGRLFDAASSLLGICDYNSYEGEAPIELENCAARTKEAVQLSAKPECWLSDLMKLRTDGAATEALARGFIHAVADWIIDICETQPVKQVVLSGGTFQNRILLERTITGLTGRGYQVYINEKIPSGDGGICVGQAYLAAMFKKQ